MSVSLVKNMPMRIGEIIDLSLDLAKPLIKSLLPFLLVLPLLDILTIVPSRLMLSPQSGTALSSMLAFYLMLFTKWLLLIYLTTLVYLAGVNQWYGEEFKVNYLLRGIGIKVIFKALLLYFLVTMVVFMVVGGLSFFVISAGTVSFAFLGQFVSYLLIGLLVILGVLFVSYISIAGIFAYCMVVIEGRSVNAAFQRSLRLLISHPGYPIYSAKTPVMRLSGLFLIITIVSLLPNVLLQYTIDPESTSSMIYAAPLTYFSSFMTYLIQIFCYLAYLGFYLDLCVRGEGLGLLPSKTSSSA